jgi:V/A-type H+-transporting ATPase subunit E
MDRIFADIRESVEKEAEQLVSRAQRVATREKQHAQREADEILSANRASVERELKVRQERATARRLVDARKATLAQREAFVEEVFTRVLVKLRDLPRDETYRAWLAGLLERGCAQFPEAQPIVSCSARDREIVRELAVARELVLADEPAEITGGLVLASADGRLTVDCSIEAELARAQDALRDEVLAKLELSEL